MWYPKKTELFRTYNLELNSTKIGQNSLEFSPIQSHKSKSSSEHDFRRVWYICAPSITVIYKLAIDLTVRRVVVAALKRLSLQLHFECQSCIFDTVTPPFVGPYKTTSKYRSSVHLFAFDTKGTTQSNDCLSRWDASKKPMARLPIQITQKSKLKSSSKPRKKCHPTNIKVPYPTISQKSIFPVRQKWTGGRPWNWPVETTMKPYGWYIFWHERITPGNRLLHETSALPTDFSTIHFSRPKTNVRALNWPVGTTITCRMMYFWTCANHAGPQAEVASQGRCPDDTYPQEWDSWLDRSNKTSNGRPSTASSAQSRRLTPRRSLIDFPRHTHMRKKEMDQEWNLKLLQFVSASRCRNKFSRGDTLTT